MLRITPAVKNLIIINVIIYFAIQYMFPNWWTYFAAYYPASKMFHPYQLVTHMFMHANMLHLFSNMFMLYMFGTTMEYVWGSRYFLFVYFASGFGAIALHFLIKYIMLQYYGSLVDPGVINDIINHGIEIGYNGSILNSAYNSGIEKDINMIINIPAMGASGAVFGIFAAFGTQFPRRMLMLIFPPVALEARYLIPAMVVVEIFLGITGNDGIAHFAHVGGAITGFLLTKYRYKFNI